MEILLLPCPQVGRFGLKPRQGVFLPSLMVRMFAIIDSKKDLLKSQLYLITLPSAFLGTLPTLQHCHFGPEYNATSCNFVQLRATSFNFNSMSNTLLYQFKFNLYLHLHCFRTLFVLFLSLQDLLIYPTATQQVGSMLRYCQTGLTGFSPNCDFCQLNQNHQTLKLILFCLTIQLIFKLHFINK